MRFRNWKRIASSSRRWCSWRKSVFGSTLTVGLNKLDEVFAATKGAMPEYKTLARLYDTFGTPRDLIRVGLEERGFVIDEDEFNRAFDAALQELQQTAGH